MRILLVEDDSILGDGIVAGLKLGDYAVDWVRDGESARLALLDHPYDACVLDLGLPDGNGVDFIRDLRAWSDVPILVLSARSNEKDKIQALDVGADDYLTKPFGVGELRARARALLRRQSRISDEASPIIEFGEARVDLSRRVVTRAGEPVHLTPIEYRLLCVLLANTGKVMTQRHLLREVWGPSFIEQTHYLRVYLAHLRKKLEANPANPDHIVTEPGIGYRFVVEP